MTDFYSLDDTLAGRATQAGLVGSLVALPDYLSSRPLRALAGAGIVAGGGALVAALNAFDEDPGNDATVMFDQLRQSIGDIGNTSGPGSDTPAGDFNVDSPARTWAIIGAAVLVLLFLLRLDAAVQRRLVTMMVRRGVRRPNTILGAVSAAVVFALSEAAHRRRVGRAQ